MHTHTSITLHPTFKRTREGFVPMITARGSKGRMIGARTPQGEARAFRTFTTEAHAISEAYVIALRCAQRFPRILRVA